MGRGVLYLGRGLLYLGPGMQYSGRGVQYSGHYSFFVRERRLALAAARFRQEGQVTSAPAARGAAARARRSTEEQAAEPRAAGTQPLHSPERTDLWFVVLLVYACQLVVHVDGTAASTAAELCRAVRAAAAAAAAGLGSPACFARSSPCSVEQWVLLSQYSKVHQWRCYLFR